MNIKITNFIIHMTPITGMKCDIGVTASEVTGYELDDRGSDSGRKSNFSHRHVGLSNP
jgi:hypothetical protein